MSFQKRSPHRLEHPDRSNGWQEFLYALLLFRNGVDVTDRNLELVAQTRLSIEGELDIWSCRPVSDYRGANRFSFRRTVDNQRYQIDKKGTSLLFVQFHGPLLSGRISVEVREPRGVSAGLEIISTWGDDFDPDIFTHFDQDRIYLRALVAEGTGQKGVLLPREHRYRVLGPSPEVERRNRDDFTVLDLNDFISYSYKKLR